MSLLCKVQRKNLYGEGGIPDQDDDTGGDDQDQDEDSVAKSLLFISGSNLTPNNLANLPSQTLQDHPEILCVPVGSQVVLVCLLEERIWKNPKRQQQKVQV